MTLSCNWTTKLITVPKSDLTLISGTRYKITVQYWWQLLRELNATEEGIVFDTMYNSTASTSSTPQIVDLINGYTAQFEDGAYSVELTDGNTNWREIEVKNQVSVGTNNTTGFIDPIFLEAGLFGDVVTIDILNGVSGTYKTPEGGVIGTKQTPSGNMDDAHEISLYRGLPTFFIVGDIDLDNDQLDLSGHSFIGNGRNRTTINVDANAIVNDCAYYDAKVTGLLDGNSKIIDCKVETLSYVEGELTRCILSPTGELVLAGTGEAHLLDCYSGKPGQETPIINLNGSGMALAMRNYSGGVLLKNKTGTEPVSIDLGSGQIKLDMTTVLNGLIVCRGVGKLTDAATGLPINSGVYGNLTIDNELLNTRTIALAVWLSNVADFLNPATMGGYIKKKLLTYIQFLSSK